MVKEAPSDATKDLIWSVRSEYEILGCMTCRVSSTKEFIGPTKPPREALSYLVMSLRG